MPLIYAYVIVVMYIHNSVEHTYIPEAEIFREEIDVRRDNITVCKDLLFCFSTAEFSPGGVAPCLAFLPGERYARPFHKAVRDMRHHAELVFIIFTFSLIQQVREIPGQRIEMAPVDRPRGEYKITVLRAALQHPAHYSGLAPLLGLSGCESISIAPEHALIMININYA